MEATNTQPANAANACSNCGGALEYDFTTNANKCAYCGSSFKVSPPASHTHDSAPDASCIRFKNDISKFKEEVIKWLGTGDQTPIDLLFGAKFLAVEQFYIPFYHFSGTYEGYYNTLNKQGKLLTQNTPLSNSFSLLTYGGIDKIEGDFVSAFARRADKKLVVPMSTIDIEGIKLAGSVSEQKTWDNSGQSQAANQVYHTLNQADPVHQHQHYLKYHTESAIKFYYPVWRAVYNYNGYNCVIYMDGVSGELNGTTIEGYGIDPPKRSSVFKKYMLIGLGFWFGLLIIRFILTGAFGKHFDPDADYFDNIIVSKIAGSYWFVRGLLFVGFYPLLMITVFYQRILNKFYAKLARIRNNNIDLIASGRRNFVFTKTGK